MVFLSGVDKLVIVDCAQNFPERVSLLEKEREAAFAVSKGECGANVACQSITDPYRRIAELEKSVATLERLNSSLAVDNYMLKDQLVGIKNRVPRLIPINEQKPASEQNVWASYLDYDGNRCMVVGCYLLRRSVACPNFYDGDVDYEAETDTYWLPVGWYERLDKSTRSCIPITKGVVDYWMPLRVTVQVGYELEVRPTVSVLERDDEKEAICA
jgi:hypothetical protein